MDATSQSNSHFAEPIIGHMRTEVARLQINETIGSAVASMRDNPPKGRQVYFYVVDENNRLRGVVPTRRLLFDDPETKVEDVMVERVVYISDKATIYDACEFFVIHRLLALPVVNSNRELLGLIDVEVYTDELADTSQEVHDDLFQLIGVHLQDARPQSPFIAFRKRFPWLLANVVGGLLAAAITSFFEQEVQKVVALALFIPVVLALAESVCIQSVSLSLEILHSQTPTMKTISKKARKEFATSMMLGLSAGVIISVVSFIWLGHSNLATALLVGITGGVTVSGMIGRLIPNFLKLLKIEPQIATGPLALAVTDVVALIVYFGTATILLD